MSMGKTEDPDRLVEVTEIDANLSMQQLQPPAQNQSSDAIGGRLPDPYPISLLDLVDSKELEAKGLYVTFHSLKRAKMNPCGDEVPTPLVPPHLAIAKIIAAMPGGSPAETGTAFLITPNVLLTAAHLLQPSPSKRATKVSVSLPNPAHPGAFVTQLCTHFNISAYWNPALPATQNTGRDYAVIFLDQPVPSNGTFPLQVVNPQTLFPGCTAYYAGYPSGPVIQYWNYGPFGANVINNILPYIMTTCDGESGGPIYTVYDNRTVVVAVHSHIETSVSPPTSSGALVDCTMKGEINGWLGTNIFIEPSWGCP